MINVIAAVAQNGAIGNKGRLLYWLPEDLKRFKALTTGHTVVMGRKTFESLPKGALPNRRNIVLSHSGRAFPGAETFGSLEDALRACEGEEVFIIGGAAVYAEAIPLADRLFLTEILDSPAEADAFFPSFSSSDWQISQTLDCPADERHAYPFRFVDYVRIK
ncbi:MAG: dihydrofolate reductase [Bacteroidaceae bacterium]|nr:dihydrofolate reductase [Bacteroidaceae bacterium]MBQ3957632.1 dihydrofolate reductase [Bacteroidaceae bacterium]